MRVIQSIRASMCGVALLIAWLVLATHATAQPLQPVPPLAARVTDLTGTLGAGDRDALEARLAAFEQSKGAQIAVLIVATTGPETIEQYSIRVVDAWQLGREEVDDGALLLVAKDDREVRIEVGQGLEGVIPDAIAKRIIEDHVTPAFRDGQFAAGINAGIKAMIARIEGEPLPKPKASARGSQADIGDLFVQTLFVAFFAAPILRSMFGRLFGAAAGAAGGGALWFLSTGALTLGGLGALVAGLAVLLIGGGRGGGPWITGSGHGGGFGGGGGGWSSGGGFGGGGGGFSGGGASGRW